MLQYQFPESGSTMFTFNVLSTDCGQKALLGQAMAKSSSSPVRIFLEPTLRNAWASMKIELPKGKQTLMWMGISMIGQQADSSSLKVIRIRKVQISAESTTVVPARLVQLVLPALAGHKTVNHVLWTTFLSKVRPAVVSVQKTDTLYRAFFNAWSALCVPTLITWRELVFVSLMAKLSCRTHGLSRRYLERTRTLQSYLWCRRPSARIVQRELFGIIWRFFGAGFLLAVQDWSSHQ